MSYYACISATEAEELSEEGSWISTDTILTFWLPVKTVIAYIESAAERGISFKITLRDAVKNQ